MFDRAGLFLICVLVFIIIFIILTGGVELFIVYKRSQQNGREYGVQEVFNNTEKAVEFLASLHTFMENFTKDLKKKYPSDDRVGRLVSALDRLKVEEAEHEEGTTSYTINKGDLMALCLRHRKDTDKFHDNNTLLFVVIHEMAHMMSLTEGHNTEFVENFKFLLKEAVAIGYYSPVDYGKNPINYCGLEVSSNPYYF